MRLLFDRERDPLEMTNFISHPDYAAIASQMESRLKKWLEDRNVWFAALPPGHRNHELSVREYGHAGRYASLFSRLRYVKVDFPNAIIVIVTYPFVSAP